MSTDLVVSRGCRHTHWYAVPDTSIECCLCCGYAIILSSSSRQPVNDFYADVQIQPRPRDTFSAAPAPLLRSDNYIYQPLDYSQTRQIRVLVLKAGTAIDPLRCELQNVNLQQGPVYEALSYTWADQQGDDSLSCTITCHGENDGDRLIAITANCESALRHYRLAEEDRRLWVDAICINQSNVMERNHQVKNMIAIFRNAVRVVVYLGDGDPELDRLLEYMAHDVGGQLPQTTDFLSLFKCRWFHRVWVLQEVAVAKSILVRYGNRQLAWDELLQQAGLFLDIRAKNMLPLMIPPVVSYAMVQTKAGGHDPLEKSDLLTLLHVSRNCSCKDPRDKVYAVTGLLKDETQFALSVDYSAPVTPGWVFLQAAAWHISKTDSLEILSQVEGTSCIKMPSWVPDWTRKSPSSLPAQLTRPPQSPAPRIVSRGGGALKFTMSDKGRIDYPLECALVVTGRKVGTVWTDRWIFGEALEDEYRSNTSIMPENQIVPYLISGSKDLASPYTITVRPHWLHRLSSISAYWPARLGIWTRLLLLYPLAKSAAAEDVQAGKVPIPADIPPAFGGPCQRCLIQDVEFFAAKKYQRRTEDKWKSSYNSNLEEIEKFLAKMYQYGANRRLFATEHSLGLGPMEAEDWDEVWLLEGAAVPFVLRKVGDDSNGRGQYKLVGACYVHGVERNSDWCTHCSQNLTRVPMVFTTIAQMRQSTGPWREFTEEQLRRRRQFNLEDLKRERKRHSKPRKRPSYAEEQELEEESKREQQWKRERQLEREEERRIRKEWQQDLQKQWEHVQQFGQLQQIHIL